jgi:anthranilate synthase component 1
MTKINITTKTKQLLSDTVTPVGLYLKLRDQFHNSFLLESSDYHGNDNNFSFICLEPLTSFIVEDKTITKTGLGLDSKINIKNRSQVISELQNMIDTFIIDKKDGVNGLFGYTNFDAVRYFETLDIDAPKKAAHSTPEMHYSLFRYIIQIDHFKNELLITENIVEGAESNIQEIIELVKSNNHPRYKFTLNGTEGTNITDDAFKALVTKGKEHCQKGDVFQIVLSRQFSQQFSGDEFNVYRALRSVNPSPYLFYFDFGDFKLFGSSPEAQLKSSNGKATINPIAGTFKRTGNDIEDQHAAEELAKDPKENAEHTMLVD